MISGIVTAILLGLFMRANCLKVTLAGRHSIPLLRAKAIYFVNPAAPNGNFEVHQLSRMALSLNFIEYLDFEGLYCYTSWKSPRVS